MQANILWINLFLIALITSLNKSCKKGFVGRIPINEGSITEFEVGEDMDGITLSATIFEDGIDIDQVEETGTLYDNLQDLSI